jgi:hypothetical protein
MTRRPPSASFETIARRCLAARSPGALVCTLRRAAIALVVECDPCILPNRRVYGSWDPVLRRLTLHAAEEVSDRALAGCLLHELWHALAPDPAQRQREQAANRAAEETLAAAPPACITELAAHLRARATPPRRAPALEPAVLPSSLPVWMP